MVKDLTITGLTFLAAVSHDLRTPLAAILGLAVTLQRQSLEPKQIKELAGRIATNARKLEAAVRAWRLVNLVTLRWMSTSVRAHSSVNR